MADYETIGAPWYQYNSQITAVEIGADITYIGKFNFYGCRKLKEVTFAENGALETIGWGAFGYTGIESIVIPATVTAINDYALYNNSSLKTVAFEEGSKLNSFGRYVFRNGVNLETVYIPDGVTAIGFDCFLNTGDVVLSVAEGSFANDYAVANGFAYETREPKPFVKYQGECGEDAVWELYSNGLLKISGSGAMADYETIGAPWYQYNSQITAVEIGADITYIGKFNFYGCKNLKAVTFAEEGALETIGWGAFGYTGLEAVTIPATVKTLNRYAFYYSLSLESVNFAENSNLTLIDAYAFRGTTALSAVNGIPAGATIHGNAFLDSAFVIE